MLCPRGSPCSSQQSQRPEKNARSQAGPTESTYIGNQAPGNAALPSPQEPEGQGEQFRVAEGRTADCRGRAPRAEWQEPAVASIRGGPRSPARSPTPGSPDRRSGCGTTFPGQLGMGHKPATPTRPCGRPLSFWQDPLGLAGRVGREGSTFTHHRKGDPAPPPVAPGPKGPLTLSHLSHWAVSWSSRESMPASPRPGAPVPAAAANAATSTRAPPPSSGSDDIFLPAGRGEAGAGRGEPAREPPASGRKMTRSP